MELVIDANILLAAFLKKAVTRELLLNDRLQLYAPEHLLLEVSRHLKVNSVLRSRLQRSDQELDQLFVILTENIQTVSSKEFIYYMPKAMELAPHKEDSPYLALALHMAIPIWSNDRGIQAQRVVKVYGTTDLVHKLRGHHL